MAALSNRPSQQGALRLLEQGYAMVGLLLVIGAIKPLFSSPAEIQQLQSNVAQVTDGSLGFQILGSSIYLIALIMLLPRYRDVIALMAKNKALVLFLILIVISMMWSELPSVTLRRALALVGTTIFGIYLAMRFSPSELMILLALALGFSAIESLLFVLFSPRIAIHWASNYGAWSGAFGHKNILGRTMVLTMLVLWAVLPQLHRYRTLIWSTFALALFLVAMSQSRTSWIVAAGLMLAVPFVYYFQRSQIPLMIRILIVAFAALGALGVVVIEYADVGLQAVGRDDTFSGRTDIWAAAIEVGIDKPLLGHGYRTFWTRGLTNRLLTGNGHNSFLDIWLELGFVGLGLFMTSFIITGRRALQRLAHSNDRRGQWYLLFLLFMLVFGMAAQVFPDHGTIPWVLFIAITMYLTPLGVAQTVGQPGHHGRISESRHQPAAAE